MFNVTLWFLSFPEIFLQLWHIHKQNSLSKVPFGVKGKYLYSLISIANRGNQPALHWTVAYVWAAIWIYRCLAVTLVVLWPPKRPLALFLHCFPDCHTRCIDLHALALNCCEDVLWNNRISRRLNCRFVRCLDYDLMSLFRVVYIRRHFQSFMVNTARKYCKLDAPWAQTGLGGKCCTKTKGHWVGWYWRRWYWIFPSK